MAFFLPSPIVLSQGAALDTPEDTMQGLRGVDLRSFRELLDSHGAVVEEAQARGGPGQAVQVPRSQVRALLEYWDLNGDGKVNVSDVVALIQDTILPVLAHLTRGAPIPGPTPVVFGAIALETGDAPSAVAVYSAQDALVAALTVSEGMFAVSLPPGQYRLETEDGRYIHDPDGDGKPDGLSVSRPGDVVGPVRLVKPKGVCNLLHGAVTCQGKPVERATVVVWDDADCLAVQERAVTDAAGKFCFEGLPNGAYQLRAYRRQQTCCSLCYGFHDSNGDRTPDAVNVQAGSSSQADIAMAVEKRDLVTLTLQAPGNPRGTVPIVLRSCAQDAQASVLCWTADAQGNLELPLSCGTAWGPLLFWKDVDGNADVTTGDWIGYLERNGNGKLDFPGDCLTLGCDLQARVRLAPVP
ncbi:MAG: carboxypeptidase regulatory-like domain-containing protein [Planctomycetes bacterium]|nr:carboxypeptidase regulatory-like domain-containing protein [Planctomycetota bacterium]